MTWNDLVCFAKSCGGYPVLGCIIFTRKDSMRTELIFDPSGLVYVEDRTDRVILAYNCPLDRMLKIMDVLSKSFS